MRATLVGSDAVLTVSRFKREEQASDSTSSDVMTAVRVEVQRFMIPITNESGK